MVKHIFSSKDPLIPVTTPKIGQLYHVEWGNSHGVVGRCIEVLEDLKLVRLQTPKTKKLFKKRVKWSDLRHTRKNQVEDPH